MDKKPKIKTPTYRDDRRDGSNSYLSRYKAQFSNEKARKAPILFFPSFLGLKK